MFNHYYFKLYFKIINFQNPQSQSQGKSPPPPVPAKGPAIGDIHINYVDYFVAMDFFEGCNNSHYVIP